MRVVEWGTIDDRESAFPQATELPDGTMVCSYSNAGGQFSTGGTDWARLDDATRTWTVEGTILPLSEDPPSSNFLKLSRSVDGSAVYAYGARSRQLDDVRFGERYSEAIVCTSTDGARTWSDPTVVTMPTSALEISHGILALPSGRLLAPAATIDDGRLGERVIAAVSDDGGRTWPRTVTVMQDPGGTLGYLEQKPALLDDGRILATAWTVTLDGLIDQPNSYAISADDGETWTAPASMGIKGQTLSTVHLRGDRFPVLYNRRYGHQGIVGALARFDGAEWSVDEELLVHDTARTRDGRQRDGGVDEMLDFEFGFPTGTARRDGTYLVTYWAVVDGRCGVRWASLQIDP
jgi:hypothetical protein